MKPLNLVLIVICLISIAYSKTQGQYPMAKDRHRTHGHNRKIKGKIIVAATGKPIAGLKVTIWKTNSITETDSNGQFIIKVPNKFHSLRMYLSAHGRFNNDGKQDSIRIDQEIYSDEKRTIIMYWMPVDNRKEHVDISAYKIPGADTTKVNFVIIVN